MSMSPRLPHVPEGKTSRNEPREIWSFGSQFIKSSPSSDIQKMHRRIYKAIPQDIPVGVSLIEDNVKKKSPGNTYKNLQNHDSTTSDKNFKNLLANRYDHYSIASEEQQDSLHANKTSPRRTIKFPWLSKATKRMRTTAFTTLTRKHDSVVNHGTINIKDTVPVLDKKYILSSYFMSICGAGVSSMPKHLTVNTFPDTSRGRDYFTDNSTGHGREQYTIHRKKRALEIGSPEEDSKTQLKSTTTGVKESIVNAAAINTVNGTKNVTLSESHLPSMSDVDSTYYQWFMRRYRSKDAFWALTCVAGLMVLLFLIVCYTRMWKKRDLVFWDASEPMPNDDVFVPWTKPKETIKDILKDKLQHLPKFPKFDFPKLPKRKKVKSKKTVERRVRYEELRNVQLGQYSSDEDVVYNKSDNDYPHSYNKAV